MSNLARLQPDHFLSDLPVPERVLIIYAHPDDAEFFAGGTLAKWAQAGAHLSLFLITSGDKGSGDLNITVPQEIVQIRKAETLAAAEKLGIQEVVFLGWKDGELSNSLALRRHIVRMIRLKRPDAIMSSDPLLRWRAHTSVNHPDHWAVAEAVQGAVYPASRDHLNFLELYQDEGLHPHKARWLYLALPVNPNFRVETTATRSIQIEALKEHRSQIGEVDAFEAAMQKRYDDVLTTDPQNPRYAEYFYVLKMRD